MNKVKAGKKCASSSTVYMPLLRNALNNRNIYIYQKDQPCGFRPSVEGEGEGAEGAIGCGVNIADEDGGPLEIDVDEDSLSAWRGIVVSATFAGEFELVKGAWSPKVARSSTSTSLSGWTVTLRSLGYDI